MKKSLLILALLSLPACTENERAKNFGSTMKVDLPPGTKFINATWKEDALWYAYRNAHPGESPDVVTLQEQSSYGVWQGKVIFTEH